MPRRHLYRTSFFPYHVTSRSNNRDWFYIPIPEVWKVLCDKLSNTSCLFGIPVYAVTLMSNHLHLILGTPQENLGEAMRHLFTEVSKAIQWRANRINHIFGTRYKWSVLDSAYSVAYVYKYVLRNPVRAGMVPSVEDYLFSSISKHPTGLYAPISDGVNALWTAIPKENTQRLKWLNLPVANELENTIQKGLRRETFRFSTHNPEQKKIRDLKTAYRVEFDDRYVLGPKGD